MRHRLCRIVYACEFQNDINTEITFPKLLLCSHSMHSKHKLRDNYPDIDGSLLLSVINHDFIQILDTTLKKFYGQARSKRTKEFWNKLVISNLVSTRFHLNSLPRDFWIHQKSSSHDDVIKMSNDVISQIIE